MIEVPDLSLAHDGFSSAQAPRGLRVLLYLGGAGQRIDRVQAQIDAEKLGAPRSGRLSLLCGLHEVIAGELAGGGSVEHLDARLKALRCFYRFADNHKLDPSKDNASKIFVRWAAEMIGRIRTNELSESTAYHEGHRVASLLEKAIGIPAWTLMRQGRLKKPSRIPRALGVQADRQRLESTYDYGAALLDITRSISFAEIQRSVPVALRFRSGATLAHWGGLKPIGEWSAAAASASEDRPTPLEGQPCSIDYRRARLINLRVESELLVFISQTGMNLAQAKKINVGPFSFQSQRDGYLVRRAYKGRKHGEVEFEIFQEYKTAFEEYLRFRNQCFNEDSNRLLFRFVTNEDPALRRVVKFAQTRAILHSLEIPYVPPSILRKGRLNWLLQRSQDPDLTADVGQHARRTLFDVYEQPNMQRTRSEITTFWNEADSAHQSPAPGACVEQSPQAVLDIPPSAPRPDCGNPAGCLFCVHHRDIDSQDHIWSLASYRHLKCLELAGHVRKTVVKGQKAAEAVIDRITEKLRDFEHSSAVRRLWVKEAEARVSEGDHHVGWDGFIRLAEILA